MSRTKSGYFLFQWYFKGDFDAPSFHCTVTTAVRYTLTKLFRQQLMDWLYCQGTGCRGLEDKSNLTLGTTLWTGNFKVGQINIHQSKALTHSVTAKNKEVHAPIHYLEAVSSPHQMSSHRGSQAMQRRKQQNAFTGLSSKNMLRLLSPPLQSVGQVLNYRNLHTGRQHERSLIPPQPMAYISLPRKLLLPLFEKAHFQILNVE